MSLADTALDQGEPNEIGNESVEATVLSRFTACLEGAMVIAETLVKKGDYEVQQAVLGPDFDTVTELGTIRHAARGVALTLCAYKAVVPSQNIRQHKAEHQGGFSARGIDNSGTVPFLQRHGLKYNVESHWLSQTFSFAGPYIAGIDLKTNPKRAGAYLVQLVNGVETAGNPVDFSIAAVQVLLTKYVAERNRGKVELEKPKELAIDQVIWLLERHLRFGYEKNAPRLPQLAIYAIYQCVAETMARYEGLTLMPLERMKTANRKSGSVGDVDVNRGGHPEEAVEIKFGVPITRVHVAEAIQKIKSASVSRYLILSTSGVSGNDLKEIARLQAEFKRTNGCEIIVNGVVETIKYYLRLIRSTSEFIFRYTTLVESDPDLSYEHRLAWNQICSELFARK